MRIALHIRILGLGFVSLGLLPVSGVGYVLYQRSKSRTVTYRDKADSNHPKGPLIAFSGCFWLWGFYLGVTAYILDNFDTSNCSFSSVSAGCNAMFTFLNRNNLGEAFGFSRYMLKQMEGREKGYFLISREEFRFWANEFFVTGLRYTDQYIKDQTESQRFLIAFTSLKGFKKRIVSQFDSWNSLSDHCVASMCVPPFWKGPIQFDDSEDLILDGGLTGPFCIPYEFERNDNYIKVDCIPNNDPRTIAPDNFFPVSWYFTPNNNLDIVLEQFRSGYSYCEEQHDMLLNAGITHKKRPSKKTLDDWIDQLKTIDRAIEDGVYIQTARKYGVTNIQKCAR